MNKTIIESSRVASQNNKELEVELNRYKKELLSLRFKLKLGELKDVSLFKKTRKAIARIKTKLSNRNKGGV